MDRLYYVPARPSAFSTSRKPLQALAKKSVRVWLEQQDAYTMDWTAIKRFPRNPYTVTNVWDVFECDLADLRDYARYNDNHRYILTVIDAFSKYLHLVPVKRKSGPSITSAFRSILADTKRRPVWVRTDKGKEFLNNHFQDMLQEEDIQFQVCRNPDVKCAVE
jgi:transposase InsO family protein